MKNKYLSIIDDAIVNLLGDLKSFRTWLLITAYLFNFFTLYLVGWRGIDYKLAGISIGLLTSAYLFYFTSKAQQAQLENQQDSEETDPPTDRVP